MNGPSVRRGCVSLAMVADAVSACKAEVLDSCYCGETDSARCTALLRDTTGIAVCIRSLS